MTDPVAIRRLDFQGEPQLMGILNVTPDSFSGDGLARERDIVAAAVDQAAGFLTDGAAILDLGGESTRPGAEPVSVQQEIDRTAPAIAAIRARFPDAVISIDSFKAETAAAALDAGADWINDVWGGRADEGMLSLAAARGCPIVLMHNRSKPGHAEIDRRLGASYVAPDYGDFLPEVLAELQALAEAALAAGVRREKILLDPGVGFGKTVRQNMVLINALDHVKALGFPVLLGASRKSFIGKVLDVPADERVDGTAATTMVGVLRGADVIRVHDVRRMNQVMRMTRAILTAEA
ncbi:MAG: dihydropteroate synthase [Marivibrio sp.]|uniref:dihydropteroate synthase n=1 Tax=Marivibrio sp. TaxID=2039719 RepID=UPI0032EEF52E